MKLAPLRRLLGSLLLLAGTALAAPLNRPLNLPPAPGEVIVKFKADSASSRQYALASRADGAAVRDALAGRAAALGARTGRPLLQAGAAVGPRMQVVRDSSISAEELAAQLAQDPEVEYAVPNGRQRRMTAPNDPYYLTGPAIVGSRGGPVSGQWYLRAPTATVVSSIDIESAWARTSGDSRVVVAVLDTGVRRDHPDLAGRLLPGYDFVSDNVVANDGDGRDSDPSDPGDWVSASDIRTYASRFGDCVAENSSWHGTKTASLVGAATNDGVGMAGTAPGVKILPVRVLGKCYGDRSDILPALRWAAGLHVDGVPDNPNPAKVINMSLGGGSCDAAYQETIDAVLAAGVTIVASAGNSNGGPVQAPASCNGVLGVTGLRHLGTKVGFSSMGPQVVIAAPGGNCVNSSGACQYVILAASNTGTTSPVAATWSDSFDDPPTVGTSFSSPLVAGVVGLMYSVKPSLTPAEAASTLASTARAFPTTGGTVGISQCRAPSSSSEQLECYCTTTTCGAGMLDAGAAVAAVATAPWLNIGMQPVAPTVGSAVTYRITGLGLAGGATAQTYAWSLVDGAGVASGFSSATNADTATLTPTGAGGLGVQLAVVDSLGANISASAVATVTATSPSGTSGGGTSGDSGGGGGGGASSPLWLALLAAAVLALRLSARPRKA
jgi:serine protease